MPPDRDHPDLSSVIIVAIAAFASIVCCGITGFVLVRIF